MLISKKNLPLACIYMRSFAFIRESCAFIHESSRTFAKASRYYATNIIFSLRKWTFVKYALKAVFYGVCFSFAIKTEKGCKRFLENYLFFQPVLFTVFWKCTCTWDSLLSNYNNFWKFKPHCNQIISIYLRYNFLCSSSLEYIDLLNFQVSRIEIKNFSKGGGAISWRNLSYLFLCM